MVRDAPAPSAGTTSGLGLCIYIRIHIEQKSNGARPAFLTCSSCDFFRDFGSSDFATAEVLTALGLVHLLCFVRFARACTLARVVVVRQNRVVVRP